MPLSVSVSYFLSILFIIFLSLLYFLLITFGEEREFSSLSDQFLNDILVPNLTQTHRPSHKPHIAFWSPKPKNKKCKVAIMARIISSNNNNNENANDEEDERSGGLKKGPWTPQEDTILIEYVKKHGEGNWNSVQRNSGLSRCGKSCRLRWANHLRPNLKKGAFSQEEEQIIIELHAKLGNKWARMASQLPGRTDNEIKNFWNTRVKRRQRAGLPIYPPDVHAEATAYNIRLQQQRYNNKQALSSSKAFSLLLSSCYPNKLDKPTNQSVENPLQNQEPDHSANNCTNPWPQNFSNENRGNETLALPLSVAVSPISHYPSSSSTLLNQNFTPLNSAPSDSHDYQYSGSLSYEAYDHGFIEECVYEPLPLIPNSTTTEISSSPTVPDSETPASSHASVVDGLIGASGMVNDYYEVAPLSPEGNSGLLDDLVMEGRNLSRSDKSKSEDSMKISYKRKYMEAEEHVDGEEGDVLVMPPAMKKKKSGYATNETQKKDFSSNSQLSTGNMVFAEDPLPEMNSMDDDLSSLLDNFPLEMPMPEWYRGGESTESLGFETQTETVASNSTGPTNQEFAWTLGTCWNNMPGTC